MRDDDDLDDIDSRDEGPADFDTQEGDDPEMVTCPNCRMWIVEDSERCPKCGHYVIASETAGVPTWVWVTAGALLVGIVGWFLLTGRHLF